MKEYRVEWSMMLDAEDEIDAAKQAWAILEDAIKFQSGATILSISDEYGEERSYVDMEYVDLGAISK
jgi:hypothetical protein